MKPAVRTVGAVEKKHRDQKKRRESKQEEYERRMLQAFVVHSHGNKHRGQSRDSPYQLLEQEFVGLSVALFGHDGRRAEHHHEADEDKDRCHSEHPAIDADALGHGKFISPRRHEGHSRFFTGGFLGGGLLFRFRRTCSSRLEAIS